MSEAVSAVIGLVGVAVGAGITWWQATSERSREKRADAQYLAIRVVCILDKYVVDCATACDDRTEMDEPGINVWVSAPAAALADYPVDVDWRCIESGLMFDILSLPRDELLAKNWLAGYEEATGCLIDEFAVERAKRYGGLGLEAAALAERLRTAYSIPAIKHGEWKPVEHIKLYFKEQEKLAQARAEAFAKLDPPPPPPPALVK